MRTSEQGLEFIAAHEGYSNVAYPDPGSGGEPWTIGFGRAHGVKPGDTCTKEQAMEWLREDVATAERAIDRLVKVDLTEEQHAALVSFIYNVGAGNFERSTMLRMINARNFDGAAAEFARWNRASGRVLAGLTKRRHAEAALFAGEYDGWTA